MRYILKKKKLTANTSKTQNISDISEVASPIESLHKGKEGAGRYVKASLENIEPGGNVRRKKGIYLASYSSHSRHTPAPRTSSSSLEKAIEGNCSKSRTLQNFKALSETSPESISVSPDKHIDNEFPIVPSLPLPKADRRREQVTFVHGETARVNRRAPQKVGNYTSTNPNPRNTAFRDPKEFLKPS